MLSPAITTPQEGNRPAASVPNLQIPYAHRLHRPSITDNFPSLSTQSLLPGSQKFEFLRIATLARLHTCAVWDSGERCSVHTCAPGVILPACSVCTAFEFRCSVGEL